MGMKDIIKSLRQSGHKVTPQRMAIIKLVMESTEYLTPSALYTKVQKLYPEIGEVTVYRTLNILSELNFVCLVHTSDNTHGYISSPSEHHGHLICSECGKVINFTGCDLNDLEKRLRSETSFNIKEHRLDFYGECVECSHKTLRKA